jgi:hypothetical protein
MGALMRHMYILILSMFIIQTALPAKVSDTVNVSQKGGSTFQKKPIKLDNSTNLADDDSVKPKNPSRIRIELDSQTPAINELGWDTEGGDRVKHNIISSPLFLLARVNNGEFGIKPVHTVVKTVGRDEVFYEVKFSDDHLVSWDIRVCSDGS